MQVFKDEYKLDFPKISKNENVPGSAEAIVADLIRPILSLQGNIDQGHFLYRNIHIFRYMLNVIYCASWIGNKSSRDQGSVWDEEIWRVYVALVA